MPMTRNNIHHRIYIFVRIDNYLISSGYKLLWVMENRNNITEFILLGLSQKKEIEILWFLLFLLCYVAILIGNLLVMISIASSQLVKQPMYFFLSHLSLADLCYTSTVTPRLIADLLAAKKIISYHGCMTQLFTMHFFGGIEVFILIGMAYDRYVAICKPLLYTLIMTRQKYVAIIVACCAGSVSPGHLFTLLWPMCILCWNWPALTPPELVSLSWPTRASWAWWLLWSCWYPTLWSCPLSGPTL